MHIKFKLSCTFLKQYFSHNNIIIGTESISELVKLTDCTCPGYNVTYECTVCGEGATVWTGCLFDCHSDEITLRHSLFVTDSASGECNNGAVVARSINWHISH